MKKKNREGKKRDRNSNRSREMLAELLLAAEDVFKKADQ